MSVVLHGKGISWDRSVMEWELLNHYYYESIKGHTTSLKDKHSIKIVQKWSGHWTASQIVNWNRVPPSMSLSLRCISYFYYIRIINLTRN